MKVTKKHNDGLTNFFGVNTGDIFLFNNHVYLRIDGIEPENGGFINAICLDTGKTASFDTERVKIVQAELIVEV